MNKMRTLKAAKLLRQGGAIAHQTATLAGIAASAQSKQGIHKIQSFKQRKAPFLLLADSVSTAFQQAIYISPSLRKLAKDSWPGAVTLVFAAKQYLHPACYQRGLIAVRVDASQETRQLAQACGGLLLSSSLNRKGQAIQPLSFKQRYRWRRHISAMIKANEPSQGKASSIYRVTGSKVVQLR